MDSAIPFYKHAIEVDPNFAAAYAHMAQAYANSSQGDLAKASIRQAFERRERASEPERFYITTRYYELATGETDKRIEALRLWRHMYPRETTAANDLAADYNDMGKFDLALVSAQDALRLSPDAYTPYENLGMAYLGLNRFSDAKAIRNQELAANLGLHWTHIDLYGIAVVENDAAAMQQEIGWAKGNTYEFFMLEIVAGVEAAAGKLQKARETYRQAMESARRAKFDGIARNMAVDLDLVETELGNASQTSRAPSAVPNSEHARKAAAHIFAMTGDLGRAGALATELLKDAPTDTYVNNVWVPSIQSTFSIRTKLLGHRATDRCSYRHALALKSKENTSCENQQRRVEGGRCPEFDVRVFGVDCIGRAGVNAIFRISWADPSATLLLLPMILREGLGSNAGKILQWLRLLARALPEHRARYEDSRRASD